MLPGERTLSHDLGRPRSVSSFTPYDSAVNELLKHSDGSESRLTATEPARRSSRRRWVLVAKLLVGTSLVVVLARSTDLRQVVQILRSTNPFLFAVVCLIAVLDRVLMAYKWNLLLRARGVFASLWQITRLYFVGYLVGSFTPGAVGGDAYRVAALWRRGKAGIILSTVVLERFVGVTVILTIAAIALPFSTRYIGANAGSWVWIITLGAAATVIALCLSLAPSIVLGVTRRLPSVSRFGVTRKLGDFYTAYAEHRNHMGILGVFTALTALEVLVLVVVNYLAARSLGVDVSFGYFLCVMPVLHILLRLPVTVQGIGVQEGLFVYFLVLAGFSAADGLAISLLHRAIEIVVLVLPGGMMLWLFPVQLKPEGKDSILS